jgi:hypothetical protein
VVLAVRLEVRLAPRPVDLSDTSTDLRIGGIPLAPLRVVLVLLRRPPGTRTLHIPLAVLRVAIAPGSALLVEIVTVGVVPGTHPLASTNGAPPFTVRLCVDVGGVTEVVAAVAQVGRRRQR